MEATQAVNQTKTLNVTNPSVDDIQDVKNDLDQSAHLFMMVFEHPRYPLGWKEENPLLLIDISETMFRDIHYLIFINKDESQQKYLQDCAAQLVPVILSVAYRVCNESARLDDNHLLVASRFMTIVHLLGPFCAGISGLWDLILSVQTESYVRATTNGYDENGLPYITANRAMMLSTIGACSVVLMNSVKYKS